MNTEFYTNLKKLRKAKKLTQEALADRAGLIPSTICEYERGKSSPTLKTILAICSALNCTASELLGV